jgi:hypothetical protein
MLKTKTERVLAFAVVFLAGCGARHLAAVIVPPAHAGEPGQRWEYVCIDEVSPLAIAGRANQFGAQGWELVAAATDRAGSINWCFKRPLGVAAAVPPPVSAH